MATSSRGLHDLSKLEPLDGSNYKRWSQKLLIFFEQLEMDCILSTDALEPSQIIVIATDNDDAIDIAAKENERAVADHLKKYEKDNRTVCGHLLNHMTNSLFDLLVNIKSAKLMWEHLEKKYGGDDAGKRKYVVKKWLQFRMVDEKSVMKQLHEYENLTADVPNEGMKMCEILQANVLLEKFSPSWTDYKNLLKHKKHYLTLQELINHMRTEKANHLKDKFSSLFSVSFNANLVEFVLPLFLYIVVRRLLLELQ